MSVQPAVRRWDRSFVLTRGTGLFKEPINDIWTEIANTGSTGIRIRTGGTDHIVPTARNNRVPNRLLM
jgi:hypothetical protein